MTQSNNNNAIAFPQKDFKNPIELLGLNEETQQYLRVLNKKLHEQQANFTIIKHLMKLVRPIQRHRGATIALLGGDKRFGENVSELTVHINKMIYMLNAINEKQNKVISQEEVEQIIYAWATISKDWENDNIIENFEFHSHLIEHLLRIISNYSQRMVDWPKDLLKTHLSTQANGGAGMKMQPAQATEGKELVVGETISGYREKELLGAYNGLLVQLVYCDLVSIAETIAKLRGLGTHAVVEGTCDSQKRIRIKYLIQEFRFKREELDVLLGKLPPNIMKEIPSLKELKVYDIKSDELIKVVNESILMSNPITISSTHFFDLCSDLIDIYFKVVDQGLFAVENLFSNQLQHAVSIQ